MRTIVEEHVEVVGLAVNEQRVQEDGLICSSLLSVLVFSCYLLTSRAPQRSCEVHRGPLDRT